MTDGEKFHLLSGICWLILGLIFQAFAIVSICLIAFSIFPGIVLFATIIAFIASIVLLVVSINSFHLSGKCAR